MNRIFISLALAAGIGCAGIVGVTVYSDAPAIDEDRLATKIAAATVAAERADFDAEKAKAHAHRCEMWKDNPHMDAECGR